MPKIDLVLTNPTAKDIPLDYQSIGDLSKPIMDVSQLSVLEFSIPNNDTPILIWPGNTYYQFSMTWGASTATAYITFASRGSGNYIYEINHLVLLMNDALKLCYANLTATVGSIAGSQSPHIIYDFDKNIYSIIVSTAFNNNGVDPYIKITLNAPLFYILESMPTEDNGNDTYSLIVNNDPWNTQAPLATGTWTNTPYTIISQEASSLSGYASPRFFVITTALPIEPEIFASSGPNAGQSTYQVVQMFTFDYSKGIRTLLLNNDYHSVVNDFRRVAVNGQAIYQVKMDIFWIDSQGGRHQFFLPPHQSAIISVMMT